MAQIQNEKAHDLAAKIDAALTRAIIPRIDEYIKKQGLTSTCSDCDSIQLELLQKPLVQLEFRSEINRGSGQETMWKNGMRKRFTSTVIAYREFIGGPFYMGEVYSAVDKKVHRWRNLRNADDVARFFCWEIARILNHI